ncbi:Uncharacterised protein [Mycobacterium tuberculosis]|nr:Uncharacterised protein [Mycobacterium tuberculosis]
MKAPRPGRLRPCGQPVILQHLPDHQRDLDDPLPRDPGHRVQVHPQLVGMIEVAGEHRMRIEIHTPQVDHPRQPGGVVNDRLRGGAARRIVQLGHVHPVWPVCRCALLKHRLGGDALDETLENHRPAGHPAHRPLGHGEVIADQIELGVALSIVVSGEDDPARMRDDDLASVHVQRHRGGHAAHGNLRPASHRVRSCLTSLICPGRPSPSSRSPSDSTSRAALPSCITCGRSSNRARSGWSRR